MTFIAVALWSDTELTPARAFTTLALFNLLRMPLRVLPMLIGMVAGGQTAANRLGEYLYAEEISSNSVEVAGSVDSKAGARAAAAVVVDRGVFVWGTDEAEKADKSKAGGNEPVAAAELEDDALKLGAVDAAIDDAQQTTLNPDDDRIGGTFKLTIDELALMVRPALEAYVC